MKTFAIFLVLAGLAVSLTGCATPAYTAQERFKMIGRNWAYEWAQAQDDIDSALLLRPASHMTIWDVQ